MLIEQIISEFELRGPGPPGRICTPITAYFHEQNKSLKKKSSNGLLLFYC